MSTPRKNNTTTIPNNSPDRRSYAPVIYHGILLFFVTIILGLAIWLEPVPEGFGTHSQLGLPACSFQNAFEIPGPSCGMTTSFAYLASGQFMRGFHTHPLAFLFFLLLSGSGLVSIGNLVSKTTPGLYSWIARSFNMRYLYVLGIFWILSWIYKLHAYAGTL